MIKGKYEEILYSHLWQSTDITRRPLTGEVSQVQAEKGRLESAEALILGKDPLSVTRRMDLEEFRGVSKLDFYKDSVPGSDEYTMRLARVIAGHSLKKMVEEENSYHIFETFWGGRSTPFFV